MTQYAHATLLRMGNFWLRTVLSWNALIQQPQTLIILPRMPNVDDLRLLDTIIDWFFPAASMHGNHENQATSEKVKRADAALREEFRLLFNGPLLIDLHSSAPAQLVRITCDDPRHRFWPFLNFHYAAAF